MVLIQKTYLVHSAGQTFFECPMCETTHSALFSQDNHCRKCGRALPKVLYLGADRFLEYRLKFHNANHGEYKL